ncbi:beta-propeller fold lactonase family protein [Conexibacter sp. SYSU D00693]|uniref:lactonase family protein n=1 Tax=Conexibacter sp. SYSU D00693 TaxID=2812560 RepID=UPI00196A9C0A|nr:beta-propeller fold lactonase family protein [Conexibacter sp. SYSU D00693]
MPLRVAVALAALVCAVAAGLPAAALAVGPVPAGGCASTAGDRGCTALRPAMGSDEGYSEALALSPDGRNAYLAVGGDYASGRLGHRSVVYVLALDPATGRLRQLPGTQGCLSALKRRECVHARGIDQAWDVAVSPDGRFVHVSAYRSNGVATFRRNAQTGRLTQLPGRDGCLRGKPRRRATERCRFLKRRLPHADSLRLTPSGKRAYIGGVAFSRSPRTGLLTPATAALQPADGRRQGNVLTLAGHGAYQFTPDGRFAFRGDGARVERFSVDGRTGALTLLGCLGCGAGSTDRGTFLLTGPTSAVVATRSSLQPLALDPTTGVLTPTGPAVDACALPDGARIADCEDVEELAVSPDGRALHVLTTLVARTLERDPATGALGLPATTTCIGPKAPCARDLRTGEPYRALTTPDGRWLVLDADGRVVVLSAAG